MSRQVTTLKRSGTLDWLVGAGLALLAFGLYLSTLAPTVLEADAGEFQFVPWLPGIAHPTGYPLYTLLGWFWTHILPVGEVAWRMNLLSAVLAAVAVGLVYGVARGLLDIVFDDTPFFARITAAAIAAASFAVTPTFWSQAIIAEVYALHSLFFAAILWLALAWAKTQGNPNAWPGKALAVTIGLSLAHHRTTVLWLPALLIFWGWHYRRRKTAHHGFTSKQLLGYGLLLGAPLLLYLYLPLIAPTTPYATLKLSETQILTLYQNSFKGFWQHVLGSVFSGELRPTGAGVERFFLTGQLLLHEIGWLGIILAAVGVGVLGQHRRVDLLLLTGLSFLAIVAFNLVYFIGDIFVLFIPAWMLLCLWLGLGLLGFADKAAGYLISRKTTHSPSPAFRQLSQQLSQGLYQIVVFGLLLVGFVFLVVNITMRNNWISQHHNTTASSRWQKILAQPIPRASVLLSNDRNELMPMWYYQYVEDRRPDLLGLFPLIVTDPAYANVGRVLDQALASGRSVYLIKPMAGLSLKADFAPVGSLVRATAAPTEPNFWHQVILPEAVITSSPNQTTTERIKLLGYDLQPTTATPGDRVVVTLYWQPVQPLSVDYTSFVHLIDETGRGLTQSDHQPGGDFYGSNYWQVGEVLRDEHSLTVPLEATAGEYRLRVGMYYQPQPEVIVGMGDGLEVGWLKIKE